MGILVTVGSKQERFLNSPTGACSLSRLDFMASDEREVLLFSQAILRCLRRPSRNQVLVFLGSIPICPGARRTRSCLNGDITSARCEMGAGPQTGVFDQNGQL